MTPTTMQIVSDYLRKELEIEQMPPAKAAFYLGILPAYVSMIKNQNTWHNASCAAWDRVKLWMDSGSRLKDWKKPNDLPILKRNSPAAAQPAEKEKKPNTEKQPVATTEKPNQKEKESPAIPLIMPVRFRIELDISITVNGQKIKI